MRVAVICPDDHPVSPGAVFAYRLGRIEDGVHNHVIHTGEVTPVEEFAAGLVEQAKREYPDHTVRIERLVDNGDNTGTWVPLEELTDEHKLHAPGGIKSADFHVTSEQTGG